MWGKLQRESLSFRRPPEWDSTGLSPTKKISICPKFRQWTASPAATPQGCPPASHLGRGKLSDIGLKPAPRGV